MKKRKREHAADDTVQDVVDYGNGGPEANDGIGEVDVALEQDISNGGLGINGPNASPLKKMKKGRNRPTDDTGEDVDYGNSRGESEPDEGIGEGDGAIEQDVSNGGLGINNVDASPPKEKKKKMNRSKNRETDTAERDVGYNRNLNFGREGNEGIGEGDGANKQDILNGASGFNNSDANPLNEKKKRKKKYVNRGTDTVKQDVDDNRNSGGGRESSVGIGSGDPGTHSNISASKKKKRRKKDNQNTFDEGEIGRDNDIGREEIESKENMGSKASKSIMSPSKGESRRKKIVRFQEPAKDDPDENVTYMPHEHDIEDGTVFISGDRNWKKDFVRQDLRYGKFTKEDDEKIKNSVLNYIKMRGWDEEEGLQTILHSSQHPDARGCWLEIAKCLPIRAVKQINSRAIRLLGDFKRGKWSPEELEELKNLQKVHGHQWTKIAPYLNRSADICKDKWRHLKLMPTRKTGSWAQDEHDKLCKLVRRSLRVQASTSTKSFDRRKIRDDINWEWIAEEMQRDSSRCAGMWYQTLASPMISTKKWGNGDDHLLLQRLMELGAASEEALDWDTILDHRDGEVCMLRWKEMTRLLGKSDHVSFEDKLELLAKRYAPDLLGIEEEV